AGAPVGLLAEPLAALAARNLERLGQLQVGVGPELSSIGPALDLVEDRLVHGLGCVPAALLELLLVDQAAKQLFPGVRHLDAGATPDAIEEVLDGLLSGALRRPAVATEVSADRPAGLLPDRLGGPLEFTPGLPSDRLEVRH